MAYTDNTIGKCDKCCAACSNAKVGTIIDTLYTNNPYATNLTSAQISELNNMCAGAKSVAFGTMLDKFVKNESVTVTDAEKNTINSFCEAFSDAEIGTKMQEMGAESDDAEFLTYYFTDHSDVTPTINSKNGTIAVTLPAGTNRAALVANFTLSEGASCKIGTTAQVSGTTSNSFTSPKTYKVTAENGTATKDWIVTVTLGE